MIVTKIEKDMDTVPNIRAKSQPKPASWNFSTSSSLHCRRIKKKLYLPCTVPFSTAITSVSISASVLLRFFYSFSLEDQGILWRVMNGSVLSNDMAFHWSDDGSCVCQFCGFEDTIRHRLWDCPATASFRGQLPVDFVARVLAFESAFSCHGWVQQSPCLISWYRMLCEIPSAVFGFCPLPEGGIVDLFTDGSCLWPSEPLFRVASWSVVLMSPLSMNPTQAQAQVLFAQALPGFRQTPARAELMAIYQALRAVLRAGVWARIWTDCEVVWRKYHAYVVAREPVKATAADSDLWENVVHIADQLGPGRVQLVKVPAHEVPEADETAFDTWLRIGNHVADRAADSANKQRPAAFWDLWETHMTAVVRLRFDGWLLMRHICDCIAVWIQHYHFGDAVAEAPKPKRTGVRKIPTMKWSNPHDFVPQKPTFSRLFSRPLAEQMAGWFRSLWDDQAPLVWVSFWQLYISFCWFGDPIHVLKVGGKWQTTHGALGQVANQWAIHTRVKWFRLMVQQFLKDCGVEFVTCTTKPVGHWIRCFKGCIGFRVCSDQLAAVERWLGGSLSTPANGQRDALKRLPDPWV